MKMRNIRITKSGKFLILIMTSLLVGVANAAIFYSLTLQPGISITSAKVRFVQGNDYPTGSSLGSNSTTAYMALEAYPNITLTYEQPLNISNTDTVTHDFRLRHISIAPASGQPQISNFTSINFVIKNAAGITQASFNYTTSADNWNTPTTTSYLTLPASAQWTIYIETKAAPGANEVTASIQIAIDVQ